MPQKILNATSESYRALRTRYKSLQEDLDHFWQLWQNDYLDALAQREVVRSNDQSSRKPPQVGEVVLIRQDAHRSTWPLAFILELHTSSDGNVRSAKIRIAKKRYCVNSCSLVSTTVNKVNQLSSIGLSTPRVRTFYEGTIQLRRTYLYRIAIMKRSSSSLLSRTASSSVQPRSRSPLTSTSSASTSASSSESVAQLIVFEAQRLLAHCEDNLEERDPGHLQEAARFAFSRTQ
ncbi:unnamed protein product [Cylicocyclus nassatus]|uniref:DUF5641 domain-containing protein n=1 Tax=Cylicocyclus nassatus TaxID=53992 RepID=A0AA36DMA8_CYLNA|nr:unnamed protein product [Cylicocyclus nassatus]